MPDTSDNDNNLPEFPLLYHAHHNRHNQDLPFWLQLAAESGGPVLELGCGTGRVLLPLAEAGHSMWGLDNDPDMLVVLRHNMQLMHGPNPGIIQADLTCYHFDIQFPLIICPCNTYSAFPASDRNAALKQAYQHLAPGGALVISIANPDVLQQMPDYGEPELEEVFPHPIDGEPVQVSSAWERTMETFTVFWQYDHLLPDGNVKRLTASISHPLVPVETYLDEFKANGFQDIVQYGDFKRRRFTRRSSDLILVARRS